MRDAVGRDVAEEGRVGEGAHEVGGGSRAQGARDGPELSVGVVEREEAEPALGRTACGRVRLLEVAHVEGLRGVGDDVGVRDADALGEAGRAGGVVEDGSGGAGGVGGKAGPMPGGGGGGRGEEGTPVGEVVGGGAFGVRKEVDAVAGEVRFSGGFEQYVEEGWVD